MVTPYPGKERLPKEPLSIEAINQNNSVNRNARNIVFRSIPRRLHVVHEDDYRIHTGDLFCYTFLVFAYSITICLDDDFPHF
jgi:hypothetical protein